MAEAVFYARARGARQIGASAVKRIRRPFARGSGPLEARCRSR